MRRFKLPTIANPETNILAARVSEFAPIMPQFQWQHASAGSPQQITIQSFPTGTEQRVLRMPFRMGASSWTEGRYPRLETTPVATLNINSTGLNGRIDGSSLTASTDYLVWAFWSLAVGGAFIGYGITKLPTITATHSSGGGLGASWSATVAGSGENFGTRLPVGCRVVVRVSTANGAEYNQGTVTARTATTLTVLMDSTYGAIGQSNAAMTAGAKEVRQLDMFRAGMVTTDSLYPGGGTEYMYTYVGHLQTDASSNIRMARKRFDFYQFPAEYTPVSAQTATLMTTLMRWCPRQADMAALRVGCEVTSSAAGRFTSIGTDAANPFFCTTAAGTVTGAFVQNSDAIPLRRYDQSFLTSISAGAGTVTANVQLNGYYGESEF